MDIEFETGAINMDATNVRPLNIESLYGAVAQTVRDGRDLRTEVTNGINALTAHVSPDELADELVPLFNNADRELINRLTNSVKDAMLGHNASTAHALVATLSVLTSVLEAHILGMVGIELNNSQPRILTEHELALLDLSGNGVH